MIWLKVCHNYYIEYTSFYKSKLFRTVWLYSSWKIPPKSWGLNFILQARHVHFKISYFAIFSVQNFNFRNNRFPHECQLLRKKLLKEKKITQDKTGIRMLIFNVKLTSINNLKLNICHLDEKFSRTFSAWLKFGSEIWAARIVF